MKSLSHSVNRRVRFGLRIQLVVATLLLLAQSSVCCNDRLKPRSEADRPITHRSTPARACSHGYLPVTDFHRMTADMQAKTPATSGYVHPSHTNW